MSVMYLALPIALLLVGAAFMAFRWTVRSGQLDDLDTPAYRALFDDESASPKQKDSGDPF
ncbi:MAG TPA: cbb3-type cytochrome oxidase assembly protein CcoS [Gemmatales bacterium]|nr:cbb3-type cytochrome oxidase assembly protein CcoS [Gemmatales bacterium]